MKKEILVILCIIMVICIIIFLYFYNLDKDEIDNEENSFSMIENIVDDYNENIKIIKGNDSVTVSDVEDDIDININKFTVDEIIFSVTAMNDVPYKYLTDYEIYQEIKDEEPKEEQFKEATDKSTSVYTRIKLFV